MADVADQAQGDIDVLNATAAAVRMPEGPKATGRCLNCGLDVEPGRRWCDTECRDDWERRHD